MDNNEQSRRIAVAKAIKYFRKKEGNYALIIKSLLDRDLGNDGEDLLSKDFVQGPAQNDKEE